jgi:aerobic-type carbon monoxide dehydrogenase small subunit (CoxS/CutS family)
MNLTINGLAYEVNAEPRETLLEVLRNRLDITGPKLVCDRGTCGACTVYLNGLPVYACMTLAIEVQGVEITTIEGLAQADRLHPAQEAIVEADAIQCGFCTPGFAMSLAAALERNPSATHQEVKQALTGHLCRCGTYVQMDKAIELAIQKMGGAS